MSIANLTVGAGSDVADIWPHILALAEERQLQAGAQLPTVRELADRLGVKPSVVRDAFVRAEGRGMVRIVPRVGAFLQTSSTAARALSGTTEAELPATFSHILSRGDGNVLHLLDARRLIETELMGRAAERRRLEDLLPARHALEAMLRLPADAQRDLLVEHDVRFHVALAQLAGNPVLAAIQQTLMELLRPFLKSVPPSLERRTLTDQSHGAIYSALVEGNAEAARCAMRAHLSMAYDCLLQDLQTTPVPPSTAHAEGEK